MELKIKMNLNLLLFFILFLLHNTLSTAAVPFQLISPDSQQNILIKTGRNNRSFKGIQSSDFSSEASVFNTATPLIPSDTESSVILTNIADPVSLASTAAPLRIFNTETASDFKNEGKSLKLSESYLGSESSEDGTDKTNIFREQPMEDLQEEKITALIKSFKDWEERKGKQYPDNAPFPSFFYGNGENNFSLKDLNNGFASRQRFLTPSYQQLQQLYYNPLLQTSYSEDQSPEINQQIVLTQKNGVFTDQFGHKFELAQPSTQTFSVGNEKFGLSGLLGNRPNNGKEDNAKEDKSKENISKEDNSKENESKEDKSNDGLLGGIFGERPKGDKPKKDGSKEDNSKENNSKEDKPKEGGSEEDSPEENKSKEDKSKENSSKYDKSKEDDSREDTSLENISKEGLLGGIFGEKPKGDKPKKDGSKKDSSEENTSKEDKSKE